LAVTLERLEAIANGLAFLRLQDWSLSGLEKQKVGLQQTKRTVNLGVERSHKRDLQRIKLRKGQG
jgi:hypothetical protein